MMPTRKTKERIRADEVPAHIADGLYHIVLWEEARKVDKGRGTGHPNYRGRGIQRDDRWVMVGIRCTSITAA